jgi:hypothetical protein
LQYAKQDLANAGLYNTDKRLKGAVSAVGSKCYNLLSVDNVSLDTYYSQFTSIFLGQPYMTISGAETKVNINSFFKNKPLSTNLKGKAPSVLPLYFNFNDWAKRNTISNNTLSIDANFTNMVSKNPDFLYVIKDTIGKTDYSNLMNYSSFDTTFKGHMDAFINGLLDKNTNKTPEGLDASKVRDTFINYFKCISKSINDFNPKNSGTNINLDNKLFLLFCCLPKNTILDI